MTFSRSTIAKCTPPPVVILPRVLGIRRVYRGHRDLIASRSRACARRIVSSPASLVHDGVPAAHCRRCGVCRDPPRRGRVPDGRPGARVFARPAEQGALVGELECAWQRESFVRAAVSLPPSPHTPPSPHRSCDFSLRGSLASFCIRGGTAVRQQRSGEQKKPPSQQRQQRTLQRMRLRQGTRQRTRQQRVRRQQQVRQQVRQLMWQAMLGRELLLRGPAPAHLRGLTH